MTRAASTERYLLTAFLVAATIAFCAPAGADETGGDLPTTYNEPPRDLRPLAVFGLGVAGQGLGLALSLSVMIANGMSDRNVEITWAVYMGVAPAVGSALGAVVAARSRVYDNPIGSMFAGSYIGAALAYLSVYCFMEHDDPKVDGSYDGGYFGESNGPDVFLGILTMGLASLILPAAGMTILYATTRNVKTEVGNVAFEPPVPIVFASARPDGPKGYGISFLRGTF